MQLTVLAVPGCPNAPVLGTGSRLSWAAGRVSRCRTR